MENDDDDSGDDRDIDKVVSKLACDGMSSSVLSMLKFRNPLMKREDHTAVEESAIGTDTFPFHEWKHPDER